MSGADGARGEENADDRCFGFSSFRREVKRRGGSLAAILAAGFAFGLAYRALFDPVREGTPTTFLLSGIHGVGLALTIFAVQTAFAVRGRSPQGEALRRLPLAVEVLIRALVMTLALTVVGLLLQFALYAETYQLRWATPHWFAVELPRVVALCFGLSLILGAGVEIQRLIGGPLLASALLGTYHRPARRNLIVMFLDIAHSTRLAESMGEERVHDLITRFFYDIDEPIRECGGLVHAYVGDEVIVSWAVGDDKALNGRCVACFYAIERKMKRLKSAYEAEFGLLPNFRAGLHAGPVIVSECGDAKRQLAFFGDTMNVGARLCEYCKTINRRLVVSDDLLRLMTIGRDWTVDKGEQIPVRGREERVEVHVVEPRL